MKKINPELLKAEILVVPRKLAVDYVSINFSTSIVQIGVGIFSIAQGGWWYVLAAMMLYSSYRRLNNAMVVNAVIKKTDSELQQYAAQKFASNDDDFQKEIEEAMAAIRDTSKKKENE